MEAAPALEVSRALLALAALLALPGLTVVRAPWSAVPFLSLAFWLVTWPWLDALHATRARFVLGALGFFTLLALMRLPRLPRARPGAATLLVLSAALASLLPLGGLAVPVGDEGPLRALSVRLLVWRDGLPFTYEPLLPLRVFGADRHAVDLLAADLALLGGVTPALATLVASLAATGLFAVALHALLTRLSRDRRASALTVLLVVGGLGLASGTPAPGAAAPATLGLALLVCGSALLVRGATRARALAAGLMLGGGAVAEPWLMTLVAPIVGLATLARLLWLPAGARPAEALRLGLAAGAATLLALPAWWRFDAPQVAWTGLVFTPGHATALATLALALGVGRLLPRASARPWWAVAVLWALLGSAHAARQLTPRWPPSPEEVRAFEAAARAVAITDLLCGERDSVDEWIPALVGRGVWPARFPVAYPEPPGRARSCRPQGSQVRSGSRPQVVAKP